MNANDCAEIENRKGANLNPNIKRSSITSPNPINRQSLKSLNEIEIPSMSEMQAKAKKFYEKAKTKFNWHSTNVEDNLAVMSIGFMLPNKDDPVIWRGPRKNGLIK